MGRRGFTTYSVCPRCGNIGYRCVEPRGGREYVYYAHYDPGSKRVRKCYVGPLYSYEHAERLLLLSLTNVEDIDLVEVAARSIEEYTDRALRGKPSVRREALEELRKIRELLESKVKLLEESLRGGGDDDSEG
ncbi:MAG: hypothetical protein QXT64_01330 [Desulfurococcaceae archaeon]